MTQEFDAIAFEEKCEQSYERCLRLASQSRSIQLEISSQHNYTDGITYFYLHNGDLELGQYYKDPWGDGWYWLVLDV